MTEQTDMAELLPAKINHCGKLLQMGLDLAHEAEKLFFDRFVCRQPLYFDRIQLGGQQMLLIRVQVGVRLPGGFYAVMPKPLRDHQDIEAHFDQQGGMGIPQAVHPDRLQAGFICQPLDLPDQIMLAGLRALRAILAKFEICSFIA